MSDSSLIDLSWNNYQISQSNELITLSQLASGTITIYTGYYTSATELRQSIYPNNFQASLALTLTNYQANFVTMENGFNI